MICVSTLPPQTAPAQTAAGLFSWDDPEPLESDDFVFRFNDNPETDVPSITHLRIAKNIKDFMAAVE